LGRNKYTQVISNTKDKTLLPTIEKQDGARQHCLHQSLTKPQRLRDFRIFHSGLVISQVLSKGRIISTALKTSGDKQNTI
jgi:hypothetical protein